MHLLLSTGTYFFTKKPCLFLFYPFICSLSLFLCLLFPYIVCSLSSVSFPLYPLSNLCPPLPSSLFGFPLPWGLRSILPLPLIRFVFIFFLCSFLSALQSPAPLYRD